MAPAARSSAIDRAARAQDAAQALERSSTSGSSPSGNGTARVS